MADEPKKMPITSKNITGEQKTKLKQLFPEIFTEDKIDFDKLKMTLGEDVDTGEERYAMTWPGKADCFKVIQQPSIATLKPCPDESVDFDETEDLFIEGDNLEVMKLLQSSYYGKIKMIYIDPPYNTGKEFIYPDNYKENLDTYLEYTGQTDSEGKKFSTNTETDGRFHSKWLNMMYPRLFLARNLLRDDGVITLHIDEHEYLNLEKLLNEIFGEENNLGTIVWDKRNPKGDAKGVAYQHEYIILFAKNKGYFNEHCKFERPKENAKLILQKAKELIKKTGCVNDRVREDFKQWIATSEFSGGEKAYCFIDDDGDVYRPVSMAWPNKKKAPDEYFKHLIHPITGKPCPVPARGWRNPPKTMKSLQEAGLILFGEDENIIPNRKYLLKENLTENVPSLLYYGGSDDSLLKEMGLSFDNPKVVSVSKRLIVSIADNISRGDIILDFFAGSCTTAHAVLDLNKEDGGNRKFIMVQLPEPCDEKTEAYKAGYKTIADIGKERIRRVINKIKEEQEGKLDLDKNNLDLGFKVFKLDKSNFRVWDGTVDENTDAESIEQQLEMSLERIDTQSSDEDILYEFLIKSGFWLTAKIEEKELAGKKVYSIEDGALLICFDRTLTKEVITEMARLEPARVICLDDGFSGNDQLKTNAVQIMRSFNVNDFRTV